MCEQAASLGLRNPSEPTTAAITSFLLVLVEGASKAKAMPETQKTDFFAREEKFKGEGIDRP